MGFVDFCGHPAAGDRCVDRCAHCVHAEYQYKKSHASAGIGNGHGHSDYVLCILFFTLAFGKFLVMVAIMVIAGDEVIPQFAAQPGFCHLTNRTGAAADDFNAVGI